MAYMHRKKKKGFEFESLRIRPLAGKDKRIIQVPLVKDHSVLVGMGVIMIDNNEEEFIVLKQPGFFDEGIIITGTK